MNEIENSRLEMNVSKEHLTCYLLLFVCHLSLHGELIVFEVLQDSI